MHRTRWSHGLGIVGLVSMIAGALDPMEGSVVILAGAASAAVGAAIGASRHSALLWWGFALVLVGVGALWSLSAVGGFGGTSGRSNWWALVILPYPIGAGAIGLVGAFRRLREFTPRAPLVK
ncbi:MAG: hypothetical protein U5K74_11685 [Gemmatimonadaceae bacterium]|nr:hypothetical protein [Gemmatimonadaceae bacterium]